MLHLRLHPSPPHPVIVVAGRIDHTNAGMVLQVVITTLRLRDAEALRLHLSQITFIDASGVAALVECQRRANLAGVSFSITDASAAVLTAVHACQARHLIPPAPIAPAATCSTSRRRRRTRPPVAGRRPAPPRGPVTGG